MDRPIVVRSGVEAERLLGDAEYQAQWQNLAAACPWYTVFQGPAFATAWFESYASEYEPIVVEQRDEYGTLVGLLTLGRLRRRPRQLVVTGAHQAEYQAWLCEPEHAREFLVGALRALDHALGAHLLVFRYLPVHFPVEALDHDAALKHRIVIRPASRPFVDVTNAKPPSAKHLKRNLGWLKRLGEVKFEKIVDADRFDAVLRETIPHYDLRHGAIHGCMPFQEDPYKAAFHRALFDRGNVLHVTALMAGERAVSVHLNTHDSKRLHLGVCSYSPHVGYASPGRVHLALLMPMISGEGHTECDLTPGGDPYKERFATAHDVVHELYVYPSRLHWEGVRLKSRVENVARSTLLRFGYDGAKLRQLLKAAPAEPGSAVIASHPRRELADYFVYSWEGKPGPAEQREWQLVGDGIPVLLEFTNQLPERKRQSVLSDMLARLGASERLLVFDDGKGTHCWAWFHPTPSTQAVGWGARALDLPPNTGCMYDLGIVGRGQPAKPSSELLRTLLDRCMESPKVDAVRLLVPAEGSPWADAATALGMTCVERLTVQTRARQIQPKPSADGE
jgi:CelD/BcsL family acetyltransferase involved in cellulose biosynthesis